MEMFKKIVRLKDCSKILIRFLNKDDQEKLVKGFSKLSKKSRYYRFFSYMPSLSSDQIKFLLENDDKNNFILGALDISRDIDYGIALARYARSTDNPTVAEFAIAIIDEYHGRGLGKKFLELLVENAKQNGIKTFIGYFIGSNIGIKNLVKDYNPVYKHIEGDIFKMNLSFV